MPNDLRLRPIRTAACAAAFLLAAPTFAGSVLFVKADAEPDGDGLSWWTAFIDLQDALDAARAPGAGVVEIWVASGRYVPDAIDLTVSFDLVPGVAVLGGFAGGETTRAQRDPAANLTILSGDANDDDVVGSGPSWYSGWNITTPNAGKVVTITDGDANTVLDGFTISGGHTGPTGTPAGSPLMSGSGITISGGAPIVRNCILEHNLAAFGAGGAVLCLDTAARLEGCTIRENYGHLSNGGGVHVQGAATPTLSDCELRWNVVVGASPDVSGAGVSHRGDGTLVVRGCRFVGNVAKSFYAVSNDVAYGGGLFSLFGPLDVRDCVFDGNTAMIGGAIMTFAPANVVNCLLVNNQAIPHPADPYPEVGGNGAAIACTAFSPRTTTIANCTIAHNHGKKHAVEGGGSHTVRVRNAIISGNTATHPEVSGYSRAQIAGSFDLGWSCVDLIFEPPEQGGDPIEPQNLPGCTQANPMLTGANDLHLLPGSPCLDAGHNGEVPAGTTLDLDGLARLADDPDAPDVGVGAAPIVDMGCYERVVVAPCPTDLDGSGATDFGDLLALLSAWGPCAGCAEDVNGDGDADFADLLLVLAAWGECL